MFEWIRRLRKPEFKPSIVADDDGVRLTFADGIEVMRWDDIDEVRAWKDDCFTYDRIAMSLHASQDFAVRLDEEFEGYDAMLDAMAKRLPGFERWSWWSGVAFPAFETNLTTIWRRGVPSGTSAMNGLEGGRGPMTDLPNADLGETQTHTSPVDEPPASPIVSWVGPL